MLAFDKIVEAINYTEQLNRQENLGKELYYSFQTNGTLLNRNNIKRLLELPNLRIGLSLDGPQEVQDKNRLFAGPDPKRGSFQKVVENFRGLNFKNSLLPTFAGEIIYHLLSNTLNYFFKRGIFFHRVNSVISY